MAILSKKVPIKHAKEAAGAMQYAGASAVEEIEAQRNRLIAAELSKLGVFGMLGAPGTYDNPSPGQWTPPGFDVFNTSMDEGSLARPDQNLAQSMPYSLGAYGNGPGGGGQGLLNTPRTGILDPNKYTENIMKSSAFRAQSMQQAEAEQMLRGEGPGWNKLWNSTIGLVSQQYATMQRTAMRDLNTAFAKSTTGMGGGHGARNVLLNDARKMAVSEDITRMKANDMYEKGADLFWSVRKYGIETAHNSTKFLENLPLINKQYLDAMGATAELHLNAAKQASNIILAGYKLKESMQPVNFGEHLLEGVIKMAVAPVMSGDLLQQMGIMKKDKEGNVGLNISGLAKNVSNATEYLKGLGKEPLQGPADEQGFNPIDQDRNKVYSNVIDWAAKYGEKGGQTGFSALFNPIFK